MTAVILSGLMLLPLTACGSTSQTGSDAASSVEPEIVLDVAFENNSSEPIGAGWERAQEIIKEKSGGKMAIEVYPDSQLGDKSSLIDSMLLGEPVCTLADGAFYADYGIKDMGILFGPFLFDDWDQCWTLIESDWYEDQCKKLEEKGLKIIASNCMYGERHTLTNVPVNSVDDLKGLKIRIPSNEIQSYGFDVLGATSTGMALGDVYQALQTKTIDGAENPIATLYGRKLHEVAPYLILDGHVKNFTTWVVSADWFNSLTEEQQNWLVETAQEAGEYNNQVLQEAEQEYLQLMIDEGVTVVEPSEEVLEGFREKAAPFYEMGDRFGWSDGLYDTVRKAMGAEGSFLSPIAFEDGSSVYAYSELLFLRLLDAFIIVESKVLSQSIELFAYDVMIVETIGICRHLRLTIGHRSLGSIVHSHRDYDFCIIEEQARVEANVGMVCHIFHVGIVAFSNPSFKTSFFRFVYTLSLCYATCKKAETFGLGFYDVIIQKS